MGTLQKTEFPHLTCRSRTRAMVWFFRVASGCCLLLATCVLLGLWIRSYESADRLHGRIRGYCDFTIASKQGRVVAFCFMPHGHPNWWKWETRTYPVDDELSFPSGDPRRYSPYAGFGVIGDQFYSVMRSTYHTPDGNTIMMFGAASATLRGRGIILPYWFLVASATLMGYLLIRPRFWRFGIRSLILVMTLSAIAITLLQALDR